MKKKVLKTLAAGAVMSPLLASADTAVPGISDAVTSIGTLATPIGGAAAGILAITLIFVGIKLGRRLLNKAG